MKQIFYLLLWLPICLFAAKEIPQPKMAKKETPAPQKAVSAEKTGGSVILIEAKDRSEDLAKAYQAIKKEKPSAMVSARLKNGTVVMNVLEIHPMPNGTLLLLKTAVPQGTETQVVSVDELIGFSSS